MVFETLSSASFPKKAPFKFTQVSESLVLALTQNYYVKRKDYN